MPLPIIEKTWEIDANQLYTAGANDIETHRGVLLGIKDSLVGVLANRPGMKSAWVVKRSSNAEQATSGDLWTDPSKLVFGSGNHSWIVLGQAGISEPFEICIDLSNADPTRITIVWAPEGFPPTGAGSTQGTTSQRPVAATEVTLLADASWLGGQTASQFRIHTMQSADGQCTRVLGFWQGHCVLFWLFDKPKVPVAGWTQPAVALATGVYDGNVTYAALHAVSTPNLWGQGRSAPMALWMSTESFGNALGGVGAKLSGPNAFDGHWPLTPIGLASLSGGSIGRHGELFDLWFGSAQATHGDTYPGDGSRQLAQFGHLVFPWDGTPEKTGTDPLAT